MVDLVGGMLARIANPRQRCGDDGVGTDGLAGHGVCPIGKEAGKGKEALARQFEEIFLFPVAFGVEPLPFVKAICYDETTVVEAVFEGCLFGEGFDSGIKCVDLDGFVFGPGWDKSPLSCFDSVGLTDDGCLRMSEGVEIARGELDVFPTIGFDVEMFGDFLF